MCVWVTELINVIIVRIDWLPSKTYYYKMSPLLMSCPLLSGFLLLCHSSDTSHHALGFPSLQNLESKSIIWSQLVHKSNGEWMKTLALLIKTGFFLLGYGRYKN